MKSNEITQNHTKANEITRSLKRLQNLIKTALNNTKLIINTWYKISNEIARNITKVPTKPKKMTQSHMKSRKITQNRNKLKQNRTQAHKITRNRKKSHKIIELKSLMTKLHQKNTNFTDAPSTWE